MDAHIHCTYTILERAKELVSVQKKLYNEKYITESMLVSSPVWNNAVNDFLQYLDNKNTLFNICFPYAWGEPWEQQWQIQAKKFIKIINFKGLHPIYFTHNNLLNFYNQNFPELLREDFQNKNSLEILNEVIKELEQLNQLKKRKYTSSQKQEPKNPTSSNYLKYFLLPQVELLEHKNYSPIPNTGTNKSIYTWEYNLGEIGADPTYLEIDYQLQIDLIEKQLDRMWLDIYDYILNTSVSNKSSHVVHNATIRLNIHSLKNALELFTTLEQNLKKVYYWLLPRTASIKKSRIIQLNLNMLWYFHAYNESSQNFELLIQKLKNLLLEINKLNHVLLFKLNEKISLAHYLEVNINLQLGIGNNSAHLNQRKQETNKQIQNIIVKTKNDDITSNRILVLNETDSPYLSKLFN